MKLVAEAFVEVVEAFASAASTVQLSRYYQEKIQ